MHENLGHKSRESCLHYSIILSNRPYPDPNSIGIFPAFYSVDHRRATILQVLLALRTLQVGCAQLCTSLLEPWKNFTYIIAHHFIIPNKKMSAFFIIPIFGSSCQRHLLPSLIINIVRHFTNSRSYILFLPPLVATHWDKLKNFTWKKGTHATGTQVVNEAEYEGQPAKDV